MKIFFVFCNDTDDAPSFPLGLGLLSALLKKNGHEVMGFYADFVNSHKMIFQTCYEQIEIFKPDVIGFSSTTPAFECVKEIAIFLRDKLSVPTICGGMHPTLYPDDVLSIKEIDYICVGEGEKPILEFLEALYQGNDVLSVPGIWGRDSCGNIKKNHIYPLPKEIDSSLSIDYDLFGKDHIDTITSEGWLRYISSRGCPYSCSYCHNKIIRKSYANYIGCKLTDLNYVRFKNVDSIITELKQIVAKYQISVINFMDDLFCFQKERTIEFCKKFKEQLPDSVGFSIQTHFMHMDEEIVSALSDSRCQRVVIGVESAAARILKIFKRPTNLKVMRNKLKLLLNAQFPLGIWTLNILGNPTETYKEMLETLAFNAINLVDICKFNYMAPYEGSDIYNFCVEKKLFCDIDHQQKFNDRYKSVLQHREKESAFLDKFFDIGHWYMNRFAFEGLEDVFLPLIKEVEGIPSNMWEDQKSEYLEIDQKILEDLMNKKIPHYSFRFRGKIIGKVIGIVNKEYIND